MEQAHKAPVLYQGPGALPPRPHRAPVLWCSTPTGPLSVVALSDPRLKHQRRAGGERGQKARDRPLQPPGRWRARPTQRGGRKERKGKKEWSVGEPVLERERKLPDKHTAAPQLLITLRFRFQTL